MFNKAKKHLRFLIKLRYDESEVDLNKVSPILNQISVDDTTNLDDLLSSFFTDSYDLHLEGKNLSSTVYFTIWKDRNLYNQVKIKPLLFYEYILKYTPEFHQIATLRPPIKGPFFFSSVRGRGRLFFRSYGMTFTLIEATFWSIIGGYQFFFNKMLRTLHYYKGVELSYRYREQMLGRKINFRRKIQKQKFEDY